MLGPAWVPQQDEGPLKLSREKVPLINTSLNQPPVPWVGGYSSPAGLGGPTSAPLEFFSATSQLSHHRFASSSDSSLKSSKHKHEASCHILFPDYSPLSANKSYIKIIVSQKSSSQDSFCLVTFATQRNYRFHFPLMKSDLWFGHYPMDLHGIIGNEMNSSTKGHVFRQRVGWKLPSVRPETNCPCLSWDKRINPTQKIQQ